MYTLAVLCPLSPYFCLATPVIFYIPHPPFIPPTFPCCIYSQAVILPVLHWWRPLYSGRNAWSQLEDYLVGAKESKGNWHWYTQPHRTLQMQYIRNYHAAYETQIHNITHSRSPHNAPHLPSNNNKLNNFSRLTAPQVERGGQISLFCHKWIINSLTTVGYLLEVFFRLWIPSLVRISTYAWS